MIPPKNFMREVYYLSAKFTGSFPQKNIINKVRWYVKKGENIILVSTQVVEAGVGFWFWCGNKRYRTYGFSIIQAGGRCK